MAHKGRITRRLSRRRFLRLSGAASGALLFGDVLAACGRAAATVTREATVITMGFLTAFTGPDAIRAQTQFNAFQLAVDEINARGGIGGRRITMIKEDDQADPGVTTNRARMLAAERRADVIVGLMSSREQQAAATALSGSGTLLLSTRYSEGKACSKNVVSTGQIPSQQVEPFVLWLLHNVGRSVYVMGTDDPWPRGSAEAIKSALEQNGGTFRGAQFFPVGTKDFRPALSGLQSLNPDLLWFLLPGDDGVTFAKQMAEVSMRSLVVTTSWDEVDAARVPGFLTGALTSQAWFMSLATPESRNFVERYQRRFGADKPLNAIGEATYDAVYLYKAAVEKAGTTQVDRVLSALPDVEFDAPQGTVRIDGTTKVMISTSLVGQVSSRGSIDVHDRLPAAPLQAAGCQAA